MGNRYQNSTRPGSGARYGPAKGGGGFFAALRTRLGSGGKESTFSTPGTGAGYPNQTNFEDEDDGRILRHRPGINPVTGTYYTQQSDPPGRRKIWPWIVLAFAIIVFFFFALDYKDPVNPAPSNSPNMIAAMANNGSPAENTWQNVAPKDTPVPTPRPLPQATATPAPTSTPTPETVSSVLKYASKGEAVKALQGQLIALGYLALGTDDGAFGDVTQSAVLSFQKVNGLQADGIAGEKTLALLDSGTAKEDPDVFVWVENKGKEYHTDKDCSDMKDPKQIKKSQAEKKKLKPCDKCK